MIFWSTRGGWRPITPPPISSVSIWARAKRMAEEISVRIARPADAAALVAFNRTMAWETERKELPLAIVTAGVDGLLRNPPQGFYVVAEAGGELAGSLM